MSQKLFYTLYGTNFYKFPFTSTATRCNPTPLFKPRAQSKANKTIFECVNSRSNKIVSTHSTTLSKNKTFIKKIETETKSIIQKQSFHFFFAGDTIEFSTVIPKIPEKKKK